MIPTSQLLYKLSQRLNKVGAAEDQKVPVEDMVLAIREAEIKLQKIKIGTHNIYGTGFESFTKRYLDLENFVTTKAVTVKKDKNKNSFTFSLPENLFIPISISLSASNGSCKNRSVEVTRIVPHAEIALLLNSPNWKPSFAHQETLASIQENIVTIYTDGFTINSASITYLRYPIPFDAEGYEDFNGVPSKDINSEFKIHLEDELLDLATLNLALSTNNPQATQASQLRLSNPE